LMKDEGKTKRRPEGCALPAVGSPLGGRPEGCALPAVGSPLGGRPAGCGVGLAFPSVTFPTVTLPLVAVGNATPGLGSPPPRTRPGVPIERKCPWGIGGC
jgi:hypothetical protein